ncbi:hypothetical protein GO755_10715 [Spirosoma sp. HMF4905]|uniref:Uncharacterized protein n=1 Tax=Spirosoma arboris TaxID=2682092 RepID=A0A7K1SAE1_9BACT|nr:hypothetical protein [Spirosoma arboris]MVM30506.1 hypothetical protein [Spirosoma arboris]
MSVKNFYQTLYQNESLFQLPGESWEPSTQVQANSADLILADVSSTPETTDLLADLDTLSAATLITKTEPVLDDLVQPELIVIPTVNRPEPVVLINTPEPLSEPAPRPTTPSILPPVQQIRLPQLNHKVLLLADEELDPSNLLFLEKILKAVNLNIEGVDLLNLHGVRDMDFPELLRGKYINHFITFGVPFERINLDIMMDRYSPVRFEGITFLMADSLPTIEADQNLKKRLWGALQRIFLQR